MATSIQRWSSSNIFHLARVTLSKLSHCSKKCSQSMEFPKYSTLTMALSMQVHSSLSSALLGVSHTRPQAPTTHSWMDVWQVCTSSVQAPARPCISVPPPAPAKPAQLLQPPPVTSATPLTPKPQTPAVPKVAPVSMPMSSTPSLAPVQPHRSGHVHTTPKNLIQEL